MRIRMLTVILIILQIAIGICTAADAADNCGYVEIHMEKDGKPVAGGSVTLYCVALWNGTEYSVNEKFKWVSLEEMQLDPVKTADKLMEEIHEDNLEGITKNLGSEGIVTFHGLQEGIYLVSQKESAYGYFPIRPFLVFIQNCADGAEIGGITAYPKLREIPKGEIPQTGDNLPPVFTFLLSGCGILWVMFKLSNHKRKQKR